jgi:tetratricopeptide (TPR) repeat protein
MRRLLCVLLILSFALIFYTAAAQTQTPPQPTLPTATPTLPSYEEIQALLAEVQAKAEEASAKFGEATNFLSIFEAIGLIVAVLSGLITVLAVVGGIIGFRGLGAAQAELETARERVESDLAQARERFDTEMQQRREELEGIRQQLEQGANEQRERAAKANLAMSFLPLGERQYRSQDFSGAIDTYNRALELDPDNLITHYRLGYVYTQSGNLDKAEEHLTRALKIENQFAPALAALGYVYRRKGEKMPQGSDERNAMLNKGEGLLIEGLRLSPKLVDDDGESWWGSLGGLYRRRGQIDDAINAYERASQVTPQSSYAFSNLALLYVHKKDKEAMMRTYQRVEQLAAGEIQADVDNYWAYADLLTARLALGKIKEAEEVFTSVLEIAPADSPYVFESLVDTLQRLRLALGEEHSKHIQTFIDGILAFVAARDSEKAAPS